MRQVGILALLLVAAAVAPVAAQAPVDGAVAVPTGPGSSGAAAAAFLEGMLLAVVPSTLPLLWVHLRASHRRQRRELGVLSLVWPPVIGSFAGMLIWLAAAQLVAQRLGPGTVLSSPGVLAALALPQLLLALAFWLMPDRLSALDRTDGHSAATALVAPVLALPWMLWTPTVAAIASGVGTHLEALAAAMGFTLPALVVALGATVLSRTEGEPRWHPPALLGFLPFLALVWVSYLLLDVLPAHVLAFVQLGWLALALVVRLAVVGAAETRRRWALGLLGAALAAGTVWLAASGSAPGP